MKYTYQIILAIVIILFSANAHAGDWQVDKAHSSVGFSVRHLGISKVKGTFNSFTANIQADKKTGKLAKVVGTVEINTVDTGISGRDDHLKAGDFFDAKKFPTAKIVTKSIKFSGDKISGLAELTMKGVTRSVSFTGEFLGSHIVDFGQGKTLRAGYSISAKINRQNFGLTFNRLAEGVSVVGDEVTIILDMQIFTPSK